MAQQKVVVILKPDCCERSLQNEVKEILRQAGLEISQSFVRILEEEEVRRLYREHAHTDTFEELVQYMASGPSEIILVEGDDAISQMSGLKGRTYSGKGIRGRFAESFIRNIVHSAETEAKVVREINLFFPEEKTDMTARKVIFGLSGMTESGKSTAGVYFDKRGVRRLKIVNIMVLIMQEECPEFTDVDHFVSTMVQKDPRWLRMAFADTLIREMNKAGVRCCSLESMGDPETVLYLRKRFPGEFVSVYIEASLEKRIQHQMIRKSLSDVEEARKILMPKDEFKISFWRMPEVKEIADVVIDNSGTLNDLYRQLDKLLERYCHSIDGN